MFIDIIEYFEVGLSSGLMEITLEEKSEHNLKDTISQYYYKENKNNI
jgi:maltodextrin utilization protein YvdJ